ncbi:hypothetical protein AB5J62_25085 [Amycolatopsis sp. cg5]|uniref:hypothetical protein n=1 Tax=Amycolatopsis sp. cg5 TaxID=3238802 RepID=UPI0035235DEB
MSGGADVFLVVLEEPAWQGQRALERLDTPLDEQRVQHRLAQGEDHQIDRHQDQRGSQSSSDMNTNLLPSLRQ